MGRYGELNKDKNEILMQIYKSQDIAKLMTIQNDPLIQPDLQEIPTLLKNNVKTAYVLPTSEESDCKLIILFINLDSISGRTFKNCIIDVNILVHQDWWEYKGNVRAFDLADRIDSVLTNNFKLSMGGLQSIGGRGYFEVGNGNPYKGFNIQFKSVDFS